MIRYTLLLISVIAFADININGNYTKRIYSSGTYKLKRSTMHQFKFTLDKEAAVNLDFSSRLCDVKLYEGNGRLVNGGAVNYLASFVDTSLNGTAKKGTYYFTVKTDTLGFCDSFSIFSPALDASSIIITKSKKKD